MPNRKPYKVSFEGAEGQKRFGYWCENFWSVYEENCDDDDRLASLYWWDILSSAEYENLFHFEENREKFAKHFEETKHLYDEKKLVESFGNSIDWVAKGNVGNVKSQASCGSCYSFAATVSLESQQSIQGGKWKNLSEQWAVDCSGKNNGCNGGWMANVWSDQIGQPTCTEEEYPYTGKKESCKVSNCSNVEPKVTGTERATTTDQLASMVFNKGPVSVAIDHKPMQRYKSGILSNCNGGQITHAVNVVGFVKNSYWLVQNSWGTGWGDKGYFKLRYGDCISITKHGQLPTIERPRQSSQNKFKNNDDEKNDGNMCDGICGQKNSHGCSCTEDCKAAGTCCQGFDFNKQCKKDDDKKDDKQDNNRQGHEVAGTNGWCGLSAAFCGTTLTHRVSNKSCSCDASCVVNANCCVGAEKDCKFGKHQEKYEVDGTKNWCAYRSWFCGHELRGGSKRCSCKSDCKANKKCCQGAVSDCRNKWKTLLTDVSDIQAEIDEDTGVIDVDA
jgi:C1A family cysteine protease